jgi:hypothetical protein
VVLSSRAAVIRHSATAIHAAVTGENGTRHHSSPGSRASCSCVVRGTHQWRRWFNQP